MMVILGLLLPTGLEGLVEYNGTYYLTNGSVAGVNATAATMVNTIIPIMILLSIIVGVIAYTKLKSSD
jgi:hypothetical protein